MKKDYQGAILGVLVVTGIWLSSCASTLSGGTIRSIEINAPVDEVFAYVADPRKHMAACDPALKSVTNLQGQGMGMTFDLTLEAPDGKLYDAKGLVLDYVPNQRWEVINILEDTGLNYQTATFFFRPLPNGGTLMTVMARSSGVQPVAPKALYGALSARYRKSFDDYVQCYKTSLEK